MIPSHSLNGGPDGNSHRRQAISARPCGWPFLSIWRSAPGRKTQRRDDAALSILREHENDQTGFLLSQHWDAVQATDDFPCRVSLQKLYSPSILGIRIQESYFRAMGDDFGNRDAHLLCPKYLQLRSRAIQVAWRFGIAGCTRQSTLNT